MRNGGQDAIRAAALAAVALLACGMSGGDGWRPLAPAPSPVAPHRFPERPSGPSHDELSVQFYRFDLEARRQELDRADPGDLRGVEERRAVDRELGRVRRLLGR